MGPTLHPVLTSHSDEPPTPSPEDGDLGPHLVLRDLPDLRGWYQQFKNNHMQARFKMDIPQVFNADGSLLLLTEYRNSIPDGTLVVATGLMKMWAQSVSYQPLCLLTFLLQGTTLSALTKVTVVPTSLYSNGSVLLEKGWLIWT